MTLRVAELESLFTADISPFEKGASKVEAAQKRIDGKKTELLVTADTAGATSNIDGVISDSKSIPDSEFEVDADTSGAEGALDDIEADAKASGEKGGEEAGSGLSGGIIAALATIPVAGAVVGIGVAIGKSIIGGLQQEVRTDRLMATTGLSPESVGILARAAGEAYADNWGDSIAANLDTAKLATQFDLLDPDATKRDAQKVISSLSGISDMLETDVQSVARATTTLLRSGLAATAEDAYDIIVKGQQEGLDVSEDWLDTLNEYSVQFEGLGISGGEAIGLLRQGLQGGARDTDVVADAMKEFRIRAVDGTAAAAVGFDELGVSSTDMTEDIAAGGEKAHDMTAKLLTGLQNIEDPIARNEAATALFGTKAEDLGDAWENMDLKGVGDDFKDFGGIAETAMSQLTDNTSNDIESAQRNIEVATNGIKGALAAAFGPQIEEWSAYVTENRAEIIGFLLDVANGAIDFGRTFIEGTAGATEAVGAFIAGPMAGMVDALVGVLNGLNALPWVDVSGPIEDMEGLADNMRTADETSNTMAENIRTNLITNGLDPMQNKLNEVGEELIWDAEVHDAQVKLANEIDEVGLSTDGTKSLVDDYNGSVDTSTASGELLDTQLKNVRQSMEDQATAAVNAGDSNAEMKQKLNDSEAALRNQLDALGLTEDQVDDLVDSYGLVPEDIPTEVQLDTVTANARLTAFKDRMNIKDIVVSAELRTTSSYYENRAEGSIDTKHMADGGIHGAAMEPLATMVPPGTLRVVGDRLDVDEAFIPLDGSPRSLALLSETMRRMPGMQGMAAGGIVGQPPTDPGITRADLFSAMREFGGEFASVGQQIADGRVNAARRSDKIANRQGVFA